AANAVKRKIWKHPTANSEHPGSNVLNAALGRIIGCWMLDVGCWMFSIGTGQRAAFAPWRFGFRWRGTRGMVQKGLSLSQSRVNQPLRWLSLTVPEPMIWIEASATL